MLLECSLSRIQVVTQGGHGADYDLTELLPRLLDSGLRCLQVREPHLRDIALQDLVQHLQNLAAPYEALMTVHAGKGEGIRVARRLKCGLQLGALWPVGGVRRELPKLLLGAAVKDPLSAEKAALEGADFVTFGPIFATELSEEACRERKSTLAQMVTRIKIPVYASGIRRSEEVKSLLLTGIYGVTVPLSSFPSDAPTARMNNFLEMLTRASFESP